jgi:PAS domain S-box-containing protein
MWSTDRELRLTAAYGAQLERLGWKPESDLGNFVGECFSTGDTADTVIGAHRRALRGDAIDFEFTRGDCIQRGHVEALRDESGAVIGCVGFASDITESKLAESKRLEAHRELERRVTERTAELRHADRKLKHGVEERQEAEEQLVVFKAFVEASGQACGMADLDGRITYANPALVALVGESDLDDVVGKHVSTYYGPDYIRRREAEIFPVTSRDGFWVGELTMISAAGEQIPVLQASFTVADPRNRPFRRGVVITDLREIRQAEQELRQSHRELKAIYDGMLDGFNILDLDTGKPVRVNSALAEMMGYTESELMELSVDLAHPREDVPWIMELAEKIAGGRISRSRDIPLLRRDDSVLYVDVASNPINYGGRRCIITFFHDITDRKLAREALLKERRALLRMAEINDSERRLIAYEVHDVVTQPMLGALLILQACRRASDPLSERVQADFDVALETLRKTSAEARKLLNQLRTPVFDQFGVATGIADLIDQFTALPGAPEITYDSRGHIERLAPMLEETLFLIAQLAISNACQFSGSDRIRVTLKQDEDEISIEVRDWGCGFDPNSVDDGRFSLTRIHERVRLLDGILEAQGSAGDGTCVRATFPRLPRVIADPG